MASKSYFANFLKLKMNAELIFSTRLGAHGLPKTLCSNESGIARIKFFFIVYWTSYFKEQQKNKSYLRLNLKVK